MIIRLREEMNKVNSQIDKFFLQSAFLVNVSEEIALSDTEQVQFIKDWATGLEF